jgi:tetratricopeptide (TPR) repeat protein
VISIPSRWRWLWLILPCAALLLAGGWIWQSGRERQEWHQAQVALDRHDLASAALHLDRYLERQPDDAAGWFLAGRTARRLEHYTQAETYLTRCQQIGGVTEATRLEWDLFRIQQGDLGDTHTRLRATITPQHPDAPLVLEALARGYLTSDRLMDAMEACDLWISRQPEHPWPWLWRGGIYERLANFDQALADFQQALKVAPEDKEVRLALGTLLSRGRQPGPAAEHFDYVLKRFPDDPDALLGLAGCRIEQGESVEAVPLLQRVMKIDPTNARAPVFLGRVALEQRDPTSAERWLRQAIEHAPDDPEAFHQLILALRIQGKQAEADRLAPRLEAIRQDIDRVDVLIRAIARNPDEAPLRHEAGVIALRLGRQEDGVRWLESALRCPGDHHASHAALAEHFAQKNDPRADLHRRLAESP